MAQDFRRVLAWEQTTTDQALTFINNESTSNTITVDIYRADGSHWSTKTVTLSAHETYAIEPGDSDYNGWNLPVATTEVGGHSTFLEDAAYGITATSSKSFSLLGYTDEQRHAGSGYSAIWTRDAVTEATWGMWNYNGDEDKADYFFIYNPGAVSATVQIVLRNSSGTQISNTSIIVGAKETVTIYPKVDLSSAPQTNNNIGVFLSSDAEIHVSVYTQLGQDYDASENPPWKTHDVVSGLFVPFTEDCIPSEYVWTDAKTSGQQQTAARVTNPNSVPVTITEEWYEYVDSAGHYNQNVYTTTTVIPAYGTAELPRASGMTNASGNDPRTHWRKITGTSSFHAHVSYFEQIDLPSVPRTSWTWGNYKPGNTDDVFLVNPTDSPVTVHVERWKNGDPTAIAGSHDIVLTARASQMASLPSEGAVPWAYGTSPIGEDSAENQTWHFYSDDAFVLHIQDWDYGDLLPLDCGVEESVEYDWGDAPDAPYETLLSSDGARHRILSNGVYLGAKVDAETEGQPSSYADGDDLFDGHDDEDGVVWEGPTEEFPSGSGFYRPKFETEVEYCMTVTASGPGFLNVWADFNPVSSTGWYDAGEHLFVDQPLAAGANYLCFIVPDADNFDAGSPNYLRFRFNADDPNGTQTPTGEWDNGEVEDYLAAPPTLDNDDFNLLPGKIELGAAYPNPFNPQTTIPYSVHQRAHLKMQVFNIQGQLEATLLDEIVDPGEYDYRWNAADITTGIYFVTMNLDGDSQTQKLILLK